VGAAGRAPSAAHRKPRKPAGYFGISALRRRGTPRRAGWSASFAWACRAWRSNMADPGTLDFSARPLRRRSRLRPCPLMGKDVDMVRPPRQEGGWPASGARCLALGAGRYRLGRYLRLPLAKTLGLSLYLAGVPAPPQSCRIPYGCATTSGGCLWGGARAGLARQAPARAGSAILVATLRARG